MEAIARFIHLGLGWIGDRGGGLERYQHGICVAHAAAGQDITAWVQSRSPIDENFPYSVVDYASPDYPRRTKLSRLQALAAERFRDRDFTFVSHHASVSSSLIPLLHNIPHVVHFHGPWADEAAIEGAPRWKTFLQRRAERKAYHSADRIITLSNAFAQLIVERYGVSPDVVRVVPGAIDTAAADPGISRSEARQRLGWPTDRPILISIRRLVKRVGIDVLIEATQQLVAKHPDLLVLIGGTGPLQGELAAAIERYGLARNVRLLGFIPDDLLSTAYAAADYSIVPTQALEGFGLVTLESMATGTPAIVTPVGSLPEVCGPLCESLVLPGKSAEAMAEGLDQILRGNTRLPDATACRRYVRENYDWGVIAPKVLTVYEAASR